MAPLDRGLALDIAQTALPLLAARGMLSRAVPGAARGILHIGMLKPQPVSPEAIAAREAATKQMKDARRPIGRVTIKKDSPTEGEE